MKTKIKFISGKDVLTDMRTQVLKLMYDNYLKEGTINVSFEEFVKMIDKQEQQEEEPNMDFDCDDPYFMCSEIYN